MGIVEIILSLLMGLSYLLIMAGVVSGFLAGCYMLVKSLFRKCPFRKCMQLEA